MRIDRRPVSAPCLNRLAARPLYDFMADCQEGWGPLSIRVTEPPPLDVCARQPYYRWLVVGTVCIGAFMGQADASIAQMVLPTLEREFDQPLRLISWVAIAYMLTLAVLLPIFGRLADRYGRKLLYTVGFLIFIVGSALCGAATTLPTLIGFRVLQAIGAALLQTNSVAIVVSAAGQKHRGHAIGLQAAAQAIGLSAGPAIGGILIDALSWRWVFWLNVPFGVLGAVMGWFVLPQTEQRVVHGAVDWSAALLLAPAMTALVLMISQGQTWGVESVGFLLCAGAVLIFVPAFIRRERRQAVPLLDLTLFERRAFWAGNVTGLMSYAMLFGVFFLMPFVFVRGYHESVLTAGLRLVVVPAAIGLVAPLSGAVYDRIGARRLTTAGMMLSVVAFALLALTMTSSAASLWPTMVGLALFGIGEGLFTSPNNSSVMGAVPAKRIGQAGGILNVMRSFGTSIGITAATAMLVWRLGRVAGRVGGTLHAPAPELLSAARDVATMFAVIAAMAAALSWWRPHHRQIGSPPPPA
jgi:EmrB/QacA subfamily drug resistance transporter